MSTLRNIAGWVMAAVAVLTSVLAYIYAGLISGVVAQVSKEDSIYGFGAGKTSMAGTILSFSALGLLGCTILLALLYLVRKKVANAATINVSGLLLGYLLLLAAIVATDSLWNVYSVAAYVADLALPMTIIFALPLLATATSVACWKNNPDGTHPGNASAVVALSLAVVGVGAAIVATGTETGAPGWLTGLSIGAGIVWGLSVALGLSAETLTVGTYMTLGGITVSWAAVAIGANVAGTVGVYTYSGAVGLVLAAAVMVIVGVGKRWEVQDDYYEDVGPNLPWHGQ